MDDLVSRVTFFDAVTAQLAERDAAMAAVTVTKP